MHKTWKSPRTIKVRIPESLKDDVLRATRILDWADGMPLFRTPQEELFRQKHQILENAQDSTAFLSCEIPQPVLLDYQRRAQLSKAITPDPITDSIHGDTKTSPETLTVDSSQQYADCETKLANVTKILAWPGDVQEVGKVYASPFRTETDNATNLRKIISLALSYLLEKPLIEDELDLLRINDMFAIDKSVRQLLEQMPTQSREDFQDFRDFRNAKPALVVPPKLIMKLRKQKSEEV